MLGGAIPIRRMFNSPDNAILHRFIAASPLASWDGNCGLSNVHPQENLLTIMGLVGIFPKSTT